MGRVFNLKRTLHLRWLFADYDLPITLIPKITAYSKSRFCKDDDTGPNIEVNCPPVVITPPDPLEPDNDDHWDDDRNPIFFLPPPYPHDDIRTIPIIADRSGGSFEITYASEDDPGNPLMMDQEFLNTYLQLSGPLNDEDLCAGETYLFLYNPDPDTQISPPSLGTYIFTYHSSSCKDETTIILKNADLIVGRQSELESYGEENQMMDLKLYKEAKKFLALDPGDQTKLETGLGELVAQYQRSNNGASATRKPQYQKLMKMAFHQFNEIVVAAHPDKLPESAITLLQTMMPLLKDEELEPKDIWESWQAPKAAASLTELEQLYKPD